MFFFYETRRHAEEMVDLKELCIVRTTANAEQSRAERLRGG